MPNKPKTYDLKAADRRRNMLIRVGLTAVVIIFATGLVFWIVSHKKQSIEPRPISVSVQEKLIKDPAGKPKVVLSLYEDPICPVCGGFEKLLGSTVQQLIDTGAVQANYYMVAFLDRGNDNYSSRAANAAYCVAEVDQSPSKDAFRRFHEMLYRQQPREGGGTYPTTQQLTEWARQAGVASEDLSKCINDGKYVEMVRGLLSAAGFSGTPTILINGEQFVYDPEKNQAQDLINKVTQITGDVPGLAAPAPPSETPASSPAAPTPTPAAP